MCKIIARQGAQAKRSVSADSMAYQGRSAFEEPERTEDGEFILGPHAHDFDNLAGGYKQQFDERGRPVNPAAAAAAKALRHAQNDVLATVGVVKKKHKQKWQGQAQKEDGPAQKKPARKATAKEETQQRAPQGRGGKP